MKWPLLIIVLLVLGFVIIQIYFIKKIKSKKGTILKLDDDEFSYLIKDKKKLMVYFWTETCSACRRQTPIMNILKREFPNVFLYNLTDNPSVARKLGIMAVPTILIIDNYKITDVLVGVQDENKLRLILKKLNG